MAPQTRRLAVALFATLVVLAGSVVHAAPWEDVYREATRLYRADRWGDAAPLFERARALNPNETGGVQISGNDRVPYLPSYFLGDALAHLGNCTAALEAWRIAEQTAGVRGDRGMRTRIAAGREKCGPAAAPTPDPFPRALADVEAAQTQATEARQAFTRAAGADAAATEASKSLSNAQAQAERALNAAGARLSQLRQSKNAATAGEVTREFTAAAGQYRQLTQQLQAAISDAAGRYDAAHRSAQASLNEAADAEKSAAAANAPAAALQPVRTQLADARTAFDEAGRTRNADGMLSVQRQAAKARDDFRAAEALGRQTQGALVTARAAVAQAQTVSRRLDEVLAGKPASAAAVSARERLGRAAQRIGGGTPSASDVTAAASDASGARLVLEHEVDTLVVAQFAAMAAAVQLRLDAAAREFERLETSMKSEQVHATADETRRSSDARAQLQRARQRFDVARAARDSAGLTEVQQTAETLSTAVAQLRRAFELRLGSATGVPAELIAAAREFFAGRYDTARTALAGARLSDKSPGVKVQASLFKAATLFGLYVRGGERDGALKREASAAVAECRALVPAFTPDPHAFSPRFIRFFQAPW
jgi:hypothetical protein